jgi:hypothetical protein
MKRWNASEQEFTDDNKKITRTKEVGIGKGMT